MANFRPYKRKRGSGGGSKRAMKRQRTKKPQVTSAMVRKLVLGAQEMKHVDALCGTATTGYYTASEATQPTAVPFMYYDGGTNQGPHTHGPSILAGSSASQRIGNDVQLMRVQVKLQLASIPNFEAVASYASSVRIVIVQSQQQLTNANSFLDVTDFLTNTSPVLAHYRLHPPSPYKILYDRTFSPSRVKGYAGPNAAGTLIPTYAVGGDSYIIKKSFNIDKPIRFGSAASESPNHNPIAVFCMLDDDNAGSSTPVWRLRGAIRYYYKDA